MPKILSAGEFTRRDPTECGDFMWGAHSHEAMEFCAVCDSTYHLHEIMSCDFKMLDEHLTRWTKKQAAPSVVSVRTEALRWLMANLENFPDIVAMEVNLNRQDDEKIHLTPDQLRDWFCWLYRKFTDYKIEKNINEKS